MTRWLLTICALVVVVEAEARAGCKGGARSLEPVGWTEGGETLVLRLSDTTDCARRDAIVRWHRDDELPAACFDLRGDKRVPTMPIPCDELRSRGSAFAPDVTGALLDIAAKATPARAPLRVTIERQGDEPRITVLLRAGSSWSQIFDAAAPDCKGRRCSPRARLFEAPSGGTAALLYEVGLGPRARTTRLAWVTLPKTD